MFDLDVTERADQYVVLSFSDHHDVDLLEVGERAASAAAN